MRKLALEAASRLPVVCPILPLGQARPAAAETPAASPAGAATVTVKPGDIVLYGSNPWDGANSHAAVYVTKGKVISHGSSSGPQIRTPVTYWGTVWGGCRYKL